jgi:hypothetical protein
MNYGTAISLAAASRALKDYNPELSKEALRVARSSGTTNTTARQIPKNKRIADDSAILNS